MGTIIFLFIASLCFAGGGYVHHNETMLGAAGIIAAILLVVILSMMSFWMVPIVGVGIYFYITKTKPS